MGVSSFLVGIEEIYLISQLPTKILDTKKDLCIQVKYIYEFVFCCIR